MITYLIDFDFRTCPELTSEKDRVILQYAYKLSREDNSNKEIVITVGYTQKEFCDAVKKDIVFPLNFLWVIGEITWPDENREKNAKFVEHLFRNTNAISVNFNPVLKWNEMKVEGWKFDDLGFKLY
jgi:hypothetical protein